MRQKKCPIAEIQCPRNADPENGAWCPAWTEISETNTVTREERLTKDCLFQLMPRLMVEVIKASNRPAAAVESARNEISDGLRHIGVEVSRLPGLMGSMPQQLIRGKDDE